MTPEQRLRWLEENQPRNLAAINAVRASLGLKAMSKAAVLPNGQGFRLEPYFNWKNRGRSSN